MWLQKTDDHQILRSIILTVFNIYDSDFIPGRSQVSNHIMLPKFKEI